MKTIFPIQKHFDPYDIWSLPEIGKIKGSMYSGSLVAKALAAGIVLADWLSPLMLRSLLGVNKSYATHTYAQLFLAVHLDKLDKKSANEFVTLVAATVTVQGGGWGLPFPWFSKNGIYPATTPYITNTPYVMEGLLRVLETYGHQEARVLFNSTWNFLESLQVMYEDSDCLAVSYSPLQEPRIVVNANSYAALAYAMHAVYGEEVNRHAARLKSIRLMRWVLRQQGDDGSWLYYADSEPGNFIDCFHSCFVLKNLHKAAALLPEMNPIILKSIENGLNFIQGNLFDAKMGLCRRFVGKQVKDPFRWDLYDQAEYLGVLIDFEQIDHAMRFRDTAEMYFRRDDDWWCRIDIFGRRWGKNFMRWGIVPFAYQSARLDAAMKKGLI